MAEPRSDVVRNRGRILDAARTLPRGDLRLNDVARLAEVGVGTVYRHFPTAHALVEALATDTLLRMRDLTREAARDPDPAAALERLITAALDLQLAEGGLQTVLLSGEDESDEVREAKAELLSTWDAVLGRARRAGVVRAEIDAARLQHLVCGLEHAVRLSGPGDRDALLGVLLRGIRA